MVIIDELADLMLGAPADVEMAIARITQWLGRGHSLHCGYPKTQRRRNHRVIKANIPARIAFPGGCCWVDLRTILDAMALTNSWADMFIFRSAGGCSAREGALITDRESKVSSRSSPASKPSYEMEIHQRSQTCQQFCR